MSTTAWAVHHTWAATAGNHPDTPPFYCPLAGDHQASLERLHAMRTRLDEDATDAQVVRASLAWRIPPGTETLWWQLVAVVATPWHRVGPATSTTALDRLQAAQALDALESAPHVTGSHPGTTPAPASARQAATVATTWCAVPAGTDPHDPDTPTTPLGSGPTDHDTALAAWDDTARDLARLYGPAPERPATTWRRLEAVATTSWLTPDQHLDPADTARALRHALTTWVPQ